MLYYRFHLQYEYSDHSAMKREYDQSWAEGNKFVETANEVSMDKHMGKGLAFFAHHVSEGRMKFTAASAIPGRITNRELLTHVKNSLAPYFGFKEVKIVNFKEITAGEFMELMRDACSFFRGYRGDNFLSDGYSMDYNIWWFSWKEEICQKPRMSYKTAQNEACRLMVDKTFTEELGRIYSAKNKRQFLGHPVHYILHTSSQRETECLTQLLSAALYSNGRLIGRRITYIYEIREMPDKTEEISNLITHAENTAVVVELRGSSQENHGNYATEYAETIEYLCSLFFKHRKKVLFVFVVDTKNPGFAKGLLHRLSNEARLIEVNHSMGDRDKATLLLRDWLAKDYPANEYRPDVTSLLKGHESYTYADLEKVYRKLEQDFLTDEVYPAYQEIAEADLPEEIEHRSAYEKLQHMIGLKAVKKVVEQIIATHKVQKTRMDMGLKKQEMSLHMVFTGNPGTAKTTVARLLAEILKKEKLLTTGDFVECGRADLVGKYVGWTAKTVKEKFKAAQGGILFIDEAYALVDDSHSFGDEAINTIVQEMENRRNHVIVIFAGYPEKMKQFIDRNEGLRSRIAFHLDFPDYSVQELMDILEEMTTGRDVSITEDAKLVCRRIIEKAQGTAEFGNGRFVRNLLEQAMMNQSLRIVSEQGNISREKMQELTSNDFDVNVAHLYSKKEGRTMGFGVVR